VFSKKILEIVFTLCLLIFSVWVVVESWKISLGSLREIGPGFYLFFSAIFMGILSLLSIIKSLMGHVIMTPAFPPGSNWRGVIWTLIISISFACFLNLLGFIIMATVFMLGLLKLVGQERLIRITIVTIITVVFSYIIFKSVLHIQLPVGFIGI